MREKSWAADQAREALYEAESALADYQLGNAIDRHRLADLVTARDLAGAVVVKIEDDDRPLRRR